jgi:long-chain acyl-CoA synthetase
MISVANKRRNAIGESTHSAGACTTVMPRVYRLLADNVRMNAHDKPVLILGEESLSLSAYSALKNQVAAALQRDGLKPGDVVAICAATSLAYVVTFMACVQCGVVVAPLAPSGTAEHLQAMLDNAQAKLIFTDADTVDRLPPPQDGLVRIALDDSAVGRSWTDWLDTRRTPSVVEPQADWPFNLIYSSGTTGVPKGILQPFGMRWTQIERARDNGYGPDTVCLNSTPLYSNTTLVSLIPTLALGGTVVLLKKFDVRGYLELAEQHRVTHTMLVPVQYQRLMDFADFERYDLSHFEAKFCTSAPFRAELKRDILNRWPGGLTEYYGMTEGGGRTELHCHLHPDKLHTVGRPAKGHDIRLIDAQGRPVGPGESGEVVGHSGAMMKGYHRLPDKTREVEWFDDAGKRFIRTGDIGRFDEDGFLILGDRKKDMIISGGFNVYPVDIESVLRSHPAVAECAVVGVSSRAWGETPVAYVVRHAKDTQDLDEASLRTWVNERVGKVQRLASLVFIDALPRSEIGKVLKRELREQHPTLP